MLALYKKFERVPRNAAPSRHRNRCWVTGRSRGFYRDFGLSRHVLREMGNDGIIPGLKNLVGSILNIYIMTKRTLRGTYLKKVRTSGFRSRMQTKTGRRILNARRKKGRNKLTV